MALINVLLIPFRTSTFSGTLSRNPFRNLFQDPRILGIHLLGNLFQEPFPGALFRNIFRNIGRYVEGCGDTPFHKVTIAFEFPKSDLRIKT